MFTVFIALLVLALTSLKKPENDSWFNDDYLSKENTVNIEGLFVAMVFLRHFRQYADFSATIDSLFVTADGFFRQLIVVPFLFYTGYGTMKSIIRKGNVYVKSLITKFLKLLIHFDICIILFWVYSLIDGKAYTLKRVLQALVAWKAIGNSDWYVFCLLCFYISVFVSFVFVRKKYWAGTLLTTSLTIVYVLLVKKAGKSSFWFNSAIILPAGMWYCLIKPYVDRFMKNNELAYIVLSCISVFLFAVTHYYRGKHVVIYMGSCFMFACLLVLLTMKFDFRNALFRFLGQHVFSIYILQRIPMMILSGYIKKPFDLYIASFAATILMAVIFDMTMKRLDAVLFRERQ